MPTIIRSGIMVYYFEYLDSQVGQYALLWSLLDAEPELYRALYRQKVNDDRPLPPRRKTRRFLVELFRKKISLDQLTKRLRDSYMTGYREK